MTVWRSAHLPRTPRTNRLERRLGGDSKTRCFLLCSIEENSENPQAKRQQNAMELQRVRILLVEDDPDDVWLMRNLLGDRWDGPFELIHVELLSAAIELCREQSFDVVLLDLGLPDSRGLGTFLRMQSAVNDLPIVVLSGYADEAMAVKAVQAGAQDYLVKGQVDDNSLVRSLRYAIERTRRRTAEEALRQTKEEFRLAQEIQQRLFPASAPNVPGFEIAGSLFPAKSAAGDYYDYFPLSDGSTALAVGDVSSHGMGPALLMSETRACLRTLAQTLDDLGDILTKANHLLTADTSDFHFVTLAVVRLNPSDRTLVYAGAGQRSYLLRNDGRLELLDTASLPLGVRDDLVVAASDPIPLNPGDLVVLMTDGVYEAESPRQERLGIDRVFSAIRRVRDRSAQTILDEVFAEIRRFTAGSPPQDDVTMVVAKVLG